jgi:hypothetical protein
MFKLNQPQVLSLIAVMDESAQCPSECSLSLQLYQLGFEQSDAILLMSMIHEIRSNPNMNIIHFKRRRQQALLAQLGGIEQLKECIHLTDGYRS